MHVVVVLGQTVVRGRLDVGQPDAIVAEVELGVVAADEDVAEDPQRSGRRRDVEAEEAAQTDCVTQLRHLPIIATATCMMAALCEYRIWCIIIRQQPRLSTNYTRHNFAFAELFA